MLDPILRATGSKTSREEIRQHDMEKAEPELHPSSQHPSQMLPSQAGLQASPKPHSTQFHILVSLFIAGPKTAVGPNTPRTTSLPKWPKQRLLQPRQPSNPAMAPHT